MSDALKPSKSFKPLAALAVACLLALGGGFYYYKQLPAAQAAGAAVPADDPALKVVAIVDDHKIYEAEVTASGLTNAVSRSQMIDEYINKALMSYDMERRGLNPETRSRIEAARREILAEGWMRQQVDSIKASITEPEIQAIYDKEITDALFSKYKLSYLIAASAEESVAKTDWVPLKGGDADWFALQSIPYQMGNVISTMKKGDSMPSPVAVREGFLRIRLDDTQPGKKPVFADMKQKITEVLTVRKQQLALQALRGKADIRIK